MLFCVKPLNFAKIDVLRFPYKLGYDCAGIVTDIGNSVKKFKVGDEVYIRLPEASRGEFPSSLSNNAAGRVCANSDMNKALGQSTPRAMSTSLRPNRSRSISEMQPRYHLQR